MKTNGKANGRMVVYINPQSSEQFKQTAEYMLANGDPAINVVCIFDANYATAEKPYLRANNNVPPTQKPFNNNIQQILDDGSVQYLQDRWVNWSMLGTGLEIGIYRNE